MLSILGDGWLPELPIKTGMPTGSGFPPAYKVDIANITMQLVIELDGQSHYGVRLEQDRKKDALLASLGWKVLRLKNEDALRLCSTSTSRDTLLTLLMEFLFTTAT